MKKKWFIVLYIVLGLVTAFGQDAVGTSTDSEVATEQGAPAGSVKTDEIVAESPQENAAALPESEASATISAADDGSVPHCLLLRLPKTFLPRLPLIRIPEWLNPRLRRLQTQMLKTNLPAPERELLRNRTIKRKSRKMYHSRLK